MTLKEKHENLIRKLAEIDYGIFFGDKNRALAFVTDNFVLIADYVNAAVRRQLMAPIWHECDEKSSFENKQGKAAYGYALIGAKRLNDLARTLDAEPLFDIDKAKLCNDFGEYVMQTLANE